MPDNSKKKILVIANTRYKGGKSGSDAIYESFAQHWDASIRIHSMEDIDYKPFFLCYLHRIILGCYIALFDFQKYDFVYSASDFLPDTLPAFIHKLKGRKWVAGYFFTAFKDNKLHYYSQKVVKKIISKYADMVIVTNKTMYGVFPHKKKTWINGGVDMNLTEGKKEFKYDAVFCGRIHWSKGIDELVRIWILYKQNMPNGRLAIIGDGDLGIEYIRKAFRKAIDDSVDIDLGVDYLGYMGEERFEIYKQSRMVLYPVPKRHQHFSMAPVEAMACGCPMVCFESPVNREVNPDGTAFAWDEQRFAFSMVRLKKVEGYYKFMTARAKDWAAQFDYKIQSERVLKSIDKELNFANNQH